LSRSIYNFKSEERKVKGSFDEKWSYSKRAKERGRLTGVYIIIDNSRVNFKRYIDQKLSK
jgi:hypothetical protein